MIRKKYRRLILIVIICLLFEWWTRPTIRKEGTIKIYDRNNILLYEEAMGIGKKNPVKLRSLPKNLITAIILTEDESFYDNWGIDPKAIIRSAFINFQNKKIITGASTITQQLVRQTVLSSDEAKSRTILRKIREILIALRLNLILSKEQILENYINNIFLGRQSSGMEAGAQEYFNKSANRLTLSEACYLVALISYPEADYEQALKRQKIILKKLYDKGIISKEKFQTVIKEKLNLQSQTSFIKAPHFVHYILEEISRMKIKPQQGIKVMTTLDYYAYQTAKETAERYVLDLAQRHNVSNAALVLVKNETAEILVMMGGIDYFDTIHDGSVNITTSLRQPGSALKPFAYAAYFSKGGTPASLIYDVKKVYKTKKGEGYTPMNYDGKFHGLILAREALASSLNLPAVEVLNRIGIESFANFLNRFGITSLNDHNRYDLSLVLGGGEVSLLELTNAYATLGREGYFLPVYSIEKIISDDGKVLFDHTDNISQRKNIFEKNGKEMSYLISDILSDNQARKMGFGENSSLKTSFVSAVKTGTTTDWHDNWCIGYTPQYTVGVWVGNNNNSPMKEISGVTGAGPIWHDFFEEFMKGKNSPKFLRPKNIIDKEICAISGLLPDGLCDEIKTEKFIQGSEPKTQSNLHKKTANGIVIDYPAEVYSWAVENDPRLRLNAIKSQASTYLEIIYPKEKAIFESLPEVIINEALVFEVNTSVNIKKIRYFIDNVFLGETNQPFKYSWKLIPGQHKLKAQGVDNNDNILIEDSVNFKVINP